jgi:hypothetical protein
VIDGAVLDTVAACPPLTIVDRSRLAELRAKEAMRLVPERAKARDAFITRQSHRLARRTGVGLHSARRTVEKQCAGVLLPDVGLPFDDEQFAGKTVADVLASPALFEGATLADPLEGISYGRCKAIVMRRADGAMVIHSFAHGRTVYELKLDYRAAEGMLAKAAPDEAAEAFVRLVLESDLEADEVERLRDKASEISGLGKRVLNVRLKAARQRASAENARQAAACAAAARQDTRPQIDAPLRDAPWRPEMDTLRQVLGASTEPEPPMRNLEGVSACVRQRPTLNMHAFAADGANDEEAEETRLPPPGLPLLTSHSEAELAELIERYIDYIDPKTGRSVHLGSSFVHHFYKRHDDGLPRVAAVATLPLVLGDGTFLACRGLERERGIVFRIPPELLAVLPKFEDCAQPAVAEAMRFLIDEWLCDVMTDYTGKCVLIALALSIIERSLLPDRPTFWVTAGRRGSGKTTAIMMALMAVTGVRPPAAAWSPNEEERRKALLAYLLDGLPAILWDNIPRGAQISCPHIEKSCTAAMYSDRKLGVSETITASAATIHVFTGNNVGPKGDLASRSLCIRLEADRPDPENRLFRHPDPVAWTEAHRGQILAALYTVLLGNPMFEPGQPVPAQTRFKTWWRLIGQPLEFAAQLHKEHSEADRATDATPGCPPARVRFKELFLAQEEEDEESASLANVLAALGSKWPNQATFLAADVAKLVNATGETGRDQTAQRNVRIGSREEEPPLRTTDAERAAVVREFLFPRIASSVTVTATTASKRLKRHVGAPVRHDGGMLVLRESPNPHTKILSFYVGRTDLPA